MIAIEHLLQTLGYQLQTLASELTVFRAEKAGSICYVVDSQYEFDYLNEEAQVYFLASEHPVLIHVPLLTSYEQYRASFSHFEPMPVAFFVQASGDPENMLTRQLQQSLAQLGLEEQCK